VVRKDKGGGKMENVNKIIVVDDEMGICQNVEKILAKSKYEVVHAQSAEEALERMARESFSLLISDIVMPEMNGLELLKLVKKEWPLTKAIMMTAYASTDTAMKAIRLGALDYIPKPFTPGELRETVRKAMSGELVEIKSTPAEKESIDIIDVDMPFDRDEVAKYTGETYPDHLTRSDTTDSEIVDPQTIEAYCLVGDMLCDIYKKLGGTCKGGLKNKCPQKAKAKKAASKKEVIDTKKLIGIDQPFDYEEVVSITGPEYVQYMDRDGFAFMPYEALKAKKTTTPSKSAGAIDVDIPFDREEVAKYTGEVYADTLTRSDTTSTKISTTEAMEFFCEVGDMVCDIFKKMGGTCKAGLKNKCPQKKAKAKKGEAKRVKADTSRLISVDMPFDYEEVAAVTGPEYVQYLGREDLSVMPYAELKKNAPVADKTAGQKVLDYPGLAAEPAYRHTLVIDDEVAVNNNIRKILASEGYHVDQAVTKAEALESIDRHPYQVILLDLRIPGVKGLELLQVIAEKQPDAKVIIITGYASIDTAVEAARIGAIDYLPKPFTPDEIRNATENAFKLAA
jgi:DNA-binding response OmpR family regulator